MAHRSGERHARQAPPPPEPESMLLAPPPPRRTEVRLRPIPQRRPPRFHLRIRWFDVACLLVIVVALVALLRQ